MQLAEDAQLLLAQPYPRGAPRPEGRMAGGFSPPHGHVERVEQPFDDPFGVEEVVGGWVVAILPETRLPGSHKDEGEPLHLVGQQPFFAHQVDFAQLEETDALAETAVICGNFQHRGEQAMAQSYTLGRNWV